MFKDIKIDTSLRFIFWIVLSISLLITNKVMGSDIDISFNAYLLQQDERNTSSPILIPLDEIAIVPGDQILYKLSLVNNGNDVNLLVFDANLTTNLLLHPDTIVGPSDLVVEWSEVDSDDFKPLYEIIDEGYVLNADLEDIENLRFHVESLKAGYELNIEYLTTLR